MLDFINVIGRAALKLAEAVHWYSAPDYPLQYGEEIDALRRAYTRVRNIPHDVEAQCDLLQLAASVMRFHDAPPETEIPALRQADMKTLVRLLHEHDGTDDPDVLVANLKRDDAVGEAATTRVAAVLRKLGGLT